jgi:hypothetical protein
MKKILLSILLFLTVAYGYSQSLNGQWKGDFDSNGDIVATGDNTTEYVLEINIEGKKVTGFSYSYFDGRKYFVICSLSGTYDKTNKTLDIIETARVKGFTPPDWNDCLQEHLLAFKKQGTTEMLTGIWRSSKKQTGGCGSGYTTLIRNTYNKELNTYNNNTASNSSSNKTKTIVPKAPQTKSTEKLPPPATSQPSLSKPDSLGIAGQIQPLPVPADSILKAPQKIAGDSDYSPAALNYEKRTNRVLKTISIESTTFNVDLYDNGAIDGDSISLFYNNKVIISHKRLSDKAISITLTINADQEVNELMMYAENLGEIPPNTALMVITDGRHRYEVNVSSDLTTSGSIHFVHGTPAISQ